MCIDLRIVDFKGDVWKIIQIGKTIQIRRQSWRTDDNICLNQTRVWIIWTWRQFFLKIFQQQLCILLVEYIWNLGKRILIESEEQRYKKNPFKDKVGQSSGQPSKRTWKRFQKIVFYHQPPHSTAINQYIVLTIQQNSPQLTNRRW